MEIKMRFYATDIAKTGHSITMHYKGFKANLMRTVKLRDNGYKHGLPPGTPVPTYPVQALPGCPEEWIRESGSYVCPVDTDWGLWFNWTQNDALRTAVLASVKGMDPVTGRKLENLRLERYVERCPVHDCDFVGDKLCEKCGYKWPAQNYVAAPNTLWWDGFRQSDGSVRQFFFSADDAKDIASLVIGKENTVPAFGFAFYNVTDKWIQENPNVTSRGNYSISSTSSSKSPGIVLCSAGTPKGFYAKGPKGSSAGGQSVAIPDSVQLISGGLDEFTEFDDACEVEVKTSLNFVAPAEQKTSGILRGMSRAQPKPKKSKSVSVGAGAEILQDVVPDSKPFDAWKTEPAGLIRLYFVFEEQFKEIVLKGGVKDLEGKKAGYLEGLPVGDKS